MSNIIYYSNNDHYQKNIACDFQTLYLWSTQICQFSRCFPVLRPQFVHIVNSALSLPTYNATANIYLQ
jgi:hypothetical protein